MDDPINLNDHAAIMRALEDPKSNPVADALAARVHAFASNLVQQAEQDGRFPRQVLLYRPTSAFDDVAIHLTLQSISEEVGQSIEVHWVSRPGR